MHAFYLLDISSCAGELRAVRCHQLQLEILLTFLKNRQYTESLVFFLFFFFSWQNLCVCKSHSMESKRKYALTCLYLFQRQSLFPTFPCPVLCDQSILLHVDLLHIFQHDLQIICFSILGLFSILVSSFLLISLDLFMKGEH